MCQCSFRCSVLALLAAYDLAIAGPPTFTDVTNAAGVATDQLNGTTYPNITTQFSGAGGAIGDFNRDGYQDIFLIVGEPNPNRLFINNRDGTFTEMAAAWGVAEVCFGAGASVGDYNNDGWPDIYMTSIGNAANGWKPGFNRLFRNNGNNTFTNVAPAAGVDLPAAVPGTMMGSAWGDYDLDGDLDLLVSCWTNNANATRLFRNNGDGTFTNANSVLGYNMNSISAYSPRFTDTDGDGYPEILWAADFGTSKYFKNNRDGTFTEMTVASGTGLDQNGMGCTTGDYDNDGDIDWYVSAIFDELYDRGGNKLYLNQGDHTFIEEGVARGCMDGGWGWGCSSVDVDLDGDLDILETNGWHFSFWFGDPARLFVNDGTAHFTESAAQAGIAWPGQGRGLVSFDIENDGDQDILIFGSKGPLVLYRNDAIVGKETPSDANWLRVLLNNDQSAGYQPFGIGARVTIKTPKGSQIRLLDNGCNHLSTGEISAAFGIGSQTTIQEIRVNWPNGRVTVRTDVAPNQTLTLRPPSLGDSNGNGAVDVDDLNDVLSGWGTAGPRGDLDGSGLVDMIDLGFVLDEFGT